ncbi:FtsX-like permease family protein [Nocardioides guangzhouensis]|uniref:FtsX-like permease family protein n=1 Tax=Nocardioides guangzhouensis TaxID=2497878 RepID=A0A4Q4Z8U9_9ACTN|nr:FtsX-like permease family protein [Nocardioides guangzhouensis]RYP83885.1 FtsX-like permease family protein [Nocardioides guangzhouensis]
MLSAELRKSVTDLSRRPARTIFTVLTLAIAVASISFFAVPTLIDRTMQDEVAAGRLADVTVAMRPVELTDDQLAGIAALPNVAAVEARSGVDARVLIGARRAPARLVGVRAFADQGVDVVRVEQGSFPGPDELLADVQDANVGVYDGSTGDTVTLVGAAGERADFTLSGRGRTLPGGEQVQDENVVVLYAPASTVARLSGEPGYGELALRLDDPSPPAARRTVEQVRRELATVPGFDGFTNLPSIRAAGDWPGKADTEQFAKLLGVITVLALISAAVLISNTLSTLVAEQTREIGVMRAVGARRRQVALVYARTTLLLGALGSLLGTLLGIALSSLLARYFGSTYWAVEVGFGVDLRVVLASVLVGLVAPPLAALPAIRRALRVDLREALEATGSTTGGQDAVDRALRRAGFLPRVMQIGLRNVGRRKRRSLATAAIVALAVGNLLAVLALAQAATDSTKASWGSHLEDVQISTSGRAPFDERARRTIVTTPGVAEAQPVLKNTVELAGREAFVWGVEPDPLFRYRLAAGRWFTADENRDGEPVAVIERNIAQNAGIDVGDTVTLATTSGGARFRIVGMATNQQEDGTALYVPLRTTRALLDRPTGASAYWVRTDSQDPAAVDRATSLLEDRLAAAGYEITSEIRYVRERDEVAANSSLTTTIAVLGFLIVAMSMVGLANAITTNVLERTREIGILRSIGARARDIRRIFTTEGVTLAVVGWLIGIPLGYLLTRLIVRLVWEIVDVRLPVVFPPGNILVALVGTTVLALLVLFLPVRRAVRFRPGDALRYA